MPTAAPSVFLYRSPGVPLVIFADQKDRYLDALEAADAGDARPFVDFVAERAVDAVELVREHLGEPGGGSAADELSAAIGGASTSPARAADRFADLVAGALHEELLVVVPDTTPRAEHATAATPASGGGRCRWDGVSP